VYLDGDIQIVVEQQCKEIKWYQSMFIIPPPRLTDYHGNSLGRVKNELNIHHPIHVYNSENLVITYHQAISWVYQP